jgi:hypothetical protein
MKRITPDNKDKPCITNLGICPLKYACDGCPHNPDMLPGFEEKLNKYLDLVETTKDGIKAHNQCHKEFNESMEGVHKMLKHAKEREWILTVRNIEEYIAQQEAYFHNEMADSRGSLACGECECYNLFEELENMLKTLKPDFSGESK